MKTEKYIEKLERQYRQLDADYLRVIGETIERLGGAAALSRALGEQERYIANAMNDRGVGSGFKTKRHIVMRIAELYKSGKV